MGRTMKALLGVHDSWTANGKAVGLVRVTVVGCIRRHVALM